MTSLDEAWNWYESTARSLGLVGRLANDHWDGVLAAETVGRDMRIRDLNADSVSADADVARKHLDDLAVVVLFSVFESTVRDSISTSISIEIERTTYRHPVLVSATNAAIKDVERGPIESILKTFKIDAANHALIEQIDQVRKYRNWVAHGKRDEKNLAQVNPRMAYERLGLFLRIAGIEVGS